MRIEDPYEKINKFRRELDKIFSKYMREVDILTSSSGFTEKARFNLKETKDKYVYEIELPGVDKEDIEIKAGDSILEVKAVKNIEKKEEKANFLHVESYAQQFYRELPLPENADEKSIKAKYSNGILRIELKKKKKKSKKRLRTVKVE